MNGFDGWNAGFVRGRPVRTGTGRHPLVGRNANLWRSSGDVLITVPEWNISAGMLAHSDDVLYGSVPSAEWRPTTMDTFVWDELAHFGIPGMKHGRRRYQNTDGSWTPLGLKERREREGFGERRAARKEAKAQRRAVRSEAKAAKAQAKATAKAEKKATKAALKEQQKTEREARIAAMKEERRKKDIRNLTDEEMTALLNRARMEQEYRELNRNPLLKTGESIVNRYLEVKVAKEKTRQEHNRQVTEITKAKEATRQAEQQTKKAENEYKKAKEEAKKANFDMQKMKADVSGGLKLERKKNLIGMKKAYKDTTIRGGIAKRVNALLSAGLKEQLTEERTGLGKARASRLLSKAASRNVKREASANAHARETESMSNTKIMGSERTAAREQNELDLRSNERIQKSARKQASRNVRSELRNQRRKDRYDEKKKKKQLRFNSGYQTWLATGGSTV